MRRSSGALAVVAGAILVMGSTGTALGQEEEPASEASAMPVGESVDASDLTIVDITSQWSSGTPLQGKKYKKAVAKAAPVAARYVIDSAGDDTIGRIIGLSLAARAAEEAGDAKTAAALIDIATLLYRNEWASAKSDNVSLNAAIEEAVAAAGLDASPALHLSETTGENGMLDVCLDPRGKGHGWLLDVNSPTGCEDEKWLMVRADASLVDQSKSDAPGFYSGDLGSADIGGVGIHKVVQDRTANDKLPGKKFKKALANAIKKNGTAIAGYGVGPSAVIEMVLAARKADEAGDAKAARAFMALALAAYRRDVPADRQTTEVNAAIDALIQAQYAGEPGLELYAQPGSTDWCFEPDEETCLWMVGRDTHWECDGAGKVLLRLEQAAAEAMGCPMG